MTVQRRDSMAQLMVYLSLLFVVVLSPNVRAQIYTCNETSFSPASGYSSCNSTWGICGSLIEATPVAVNLIEGMSALAEACGIRCDSSASNCYAFQLFPVNPDYPIIPSELKANCSLYTNVQGLYSGDVSEIGTYVSQSQNIKWCGTSCNDCPTTQVKKIQS